MSWDRHRTEVRAATRVLFERYQSILERLPQDPTDQSEIGLANLAWMCRTAIEGIDSYPVDKLSRWLGFVQGVLALRGHIKVSEERDFSRPLFHAAYQAAGIDIPPTKNMAGRQRPSR